MIKNIDAIIYWRLFGSAEYNDLDPKPAIFQEIAPFGTASPVITINNISSRTNKFWARIQVVQFGIWSKTKAGIEPIKNCLAEVFNRWKSDEVSYSWELNTKWLYDEKINEFWLAVDYCFKVIDNDY